MSDENLKPPINQEKIDFFAIASKNFRSLHSEVYTARTALLFENIDPDFEEKSKDNIFKHEYAIGQLNDSLKINGMQNEFIEEELKAAQVEYFFAPDQYEIIDRIAYLLEMSKDSQKVIDSNTIAHLKNLVMDKVIDLQFELNNSSNIMNSKQEIISIIVEQLGLELVKPQGVLV